MKKFYVFFIAGFILLSALLYFSIWWFLGSACLILFYIIYHFYNARLKTFDITVEELETQVEELQTQLDHSLIKEQNATKEAGQIRKLKQELLTIISHEIRTPMNGVLGMTLLLEDTILTKEQKEYTHTIKHSGQNLLATVNNILVNDILDYSKLDRKDKKLENINFDLRDTVEEVLNMFAEKAGIAGLDLLYDIDDNVPLQLLGDNKRLREVLMNLVENAVKFTQRGEIVVAIRSLNKDSNQPVLSFEVKDSGIGISEDLIGQLFYTNSNSEFSNENDKPGVGLVICRKQVELMGGKIEVTSTPGSGSSFTFTIPLNSSKTVSRSHVQPDNMIILEGKHVLVADDNLTSRTLLMKQLKAWKMMPVGAESGMQALEILMQHSNFDLLITDINMQQLDGLQLAKSVNNKYSHIPVILLNLPGHETYKHQQELFSAVVSKPIRQYLLRDNILAVLAKPIAEKQNKEQVKLEDEFSKQFPLRILIAEDNLINQKIAMKILTKLGYEPKIANNGREAVDMCGKQQYDIILMDVQMPEMDGLDATRMIRSTFSIQPVIMAMTANVLQGDRDSCMQAGMDDYISKPIILDVLLSHLKKWALVIKERQKR